MGYGRLHECLEVNVYLVIDGYYNHHYKAEYSI